MLPLHTIKLRFNYNYSRFPPSVPASGGACSEAAWSLALVPMRLDEDGARSRKCGIPTLEPERERMRTLPVPLRRNATGLSARAPVNVRRFRRLALSGGVSDDADGEARRIRTTDRD